ncbi:MAG: 2-polyprenyl-3-methyl-6-methoxy-1,4-benzoquinone monooxygenase [Gammaproteobacteria bacterium]
MKPPNRTLSPLDTFVGHADAVMRRVFGPPPTTERPSPATAAADGSLSTDDRVRAGRLMRVNHTGEVCAQALYHGQSVTARAAPVQEKLEHAADEENDHLAWCAERLQALGSRRSYFDPLWYAGSFAIGAVAGAAGDKWNLGFLAETERQVVAHLGSHLERLPTADYKSRAVLEQMRIDEATHATTALEAGGATLPWPVPTLMRLASKVMTETAYWI